MKENLFDENENNFIGTSSAYLLSNFFFKNYNMFNCALKARFTYSF